MIQTNDGLNSFDNDDDIISSPASTTDTQQNSGTVNVQGTTFTEEEIEEANKPQPNVILNKADVNNNTASSYRDSERVNSRSNEAPDSTDSNSGGIISGGAKGVSQS